MVQKRKKIYFSVISLTGAHIFTKIKNTDGSKKKKNLFFSYFIDRGSHFYKNKKYRWFKKEKKSIFQLFHFRDF